MEMTETNGVQNCSTEQCLSPDIVTICEQRIVGQVLVSVGRDSWCACDCPTTVRAAASGLEPRADRANPPVAVEKCSSSFCNTSPALPLMCQGFERGQPVLIQNNEGEFCNCACWGGAPAPYRIADGDGLDQIPVGTFVQACGMGLNWLSVPLRLSELPLQAYPQPAVQVVSGSIELMVPRTHLFLTYQKKLIPAKKLNRRIALMGPDGAPVSLDKVARIETDRTFQFVSTMNAVPNADLDYHLLNSDGIISADYAVQKAYQQHELPGHLIALGYD